MKKKAHVGLTRRPYEPQMGADTSVPEEQLGLGTNSVEEPGEKGAYDVFLQAVGMKSEWTPPQDGLQMFEDYKKHAPDLKLLRQTPAAVLFSGLA